MSVEILDIWCAGLVLYRVIYWVNITLKYKLTLIMLLLLHIGIHNDNLPIRHALILIILICHQTLNIYDKSVIHLPPLTKALGPSLSLLSTLLPSMSSAVLEPVHVKVLPQ